MFLKKVIKELKRGGLKKTGGTDSPRYCYSVWMRHLVLASNHGLPLPNVLAELGPGDSIGVGLAALLSGVNRYYAFDIRKYSTSKRDLKILEELIVLFKNRESIPDQNEFPNVKPYLDSYEFPNHILTESILLKSLNKDRLMQLEKAVINANHGEEEIFIKYFAPYYDETLLEQERVDMILSQAVMEHIDDLEKTYKILFNRLKSGGYMSHQIDFKCHGTSKHWNGHWKYSERLWSIVRFLVKIFSPALLISRNPYSVHLDLINKTGFKIIYDQKVENKSGIKRSGLSDKFKDLSDNDLTTSGAYILAVKKIKPEIFLSDK